MLRAYINRICMETPFFGNTTVFAMGGIRLEPAPLHVVPGPAVAMYNPGLGHWSRVHGLLHKAIEDKSARMRGASVEPKSKLLQV